MEEGLLSLKWNNHKSTFFQILALLREKHTYTDVTLACDGRLYPVHKFILATCSEYFSDIFNSNSGNNIVIVLKDVRRQDLEYLLDYMYLGQVDVAQSELSSLIKTAECLKIKGLAIPDDEPQTALRRVAEEREPDISPPSKKKRHHADDNRTIGASANSSNNISSRIQPILAIPPPSLPPHTMQQQALLQRLQVPVSQPQIPPTSQFGVKSHPSSMTHITSPRTVHVTTSSTHPSHAPPLSSPTQPSAMPVIKQEVTEPPETDYGHENFEDAKPDVSESQHLDQDMAVAGPSGIQGSADNWDGESDLGGYAGGEAYSEGSLEETGVDSEAQGEHGMRRRRRTLSAVGHDLSSLHQQSANGVPNSLVVGNDTSTTHFFQNHSSSRNHKDAASVTLASLSPGSSMHKSSSVPNDVSVGGFGFADISEELSQDFLLSLQQHEGVHGGLEGAADLLCPYCGKVSRCLSQLQTHLRIHTESKEPKTARRIRYAKQCLIVTTAALVSIPSGMIQLWPNVFASHLAISNSTIFGYEIELAPWQMDLVASVAQIGGLVGFLTAGYLVSSVGRRWSLVITAIPGIFGAALITLAVNTHMIILGRFLDGITNGMMNVAVFIYIAETADLKIRGGMCMLSHMLMQSGGILTVSLGIILSWYHMSFICGCFLVLHCLLVPTLKESPSFLAIKSHDKEALKILRKLRGSYADIKEELAYLQKVNQSSSKKTGYGVLLKKEHLKTIALMSGIFFIHNFCGTQVLRVNATRLLQELGLTLDPKMTTLMVIAVLFIGNFFMTCILDSFGRRRCIMTSLAIVAFSYTVLGTFIYLVDTQPSLFELEIDGLKPGFNMTVTEGISDSSTGVGIKDWLPLSCLMLAAFGHAMGIGPLVWVLSPEMFPTNIRSQGTGICTMIGSLQTFAVLQLFSQMQATLTQAGLYWTFAAVSIGGIIYIYFLLKETSGSRVG